MNSRQQTDDPYYFMNRGMMMMGQGLTEILTNQKFEGDYLSGVMEPHDMPVGIVSQFYQGKRRAQAETG